LKLGNGDEELILTMNTNEFMLNRSGSGKTDFQEDFGKGIQRMPVPDLPDGEYEVRILMDRSSIEVFLNKGQYVMTAQLFPNEDYKTLKIVNTSNKEQEFKAFSVNAVEGIW
jgi:fructan beta-fructosidase